MFSKACRVVTLAIWMLGLIKHGSAGINCKGNGFCFLGLGAMGQLEMAMQARVDDGNGTDHFGNGGQLLRNHLHRSTDAM